MAGVRWLLRTVFPGRPRRRARARIGSGPSFAFHSVAVLLAGCFVVIATAASFPHTTATAIAFAFSIGVEVLTVPTVVLAARRPGLGYALICALTGVLACWTIVATAGTFVASTARWIAFGSGFGYMIAGLVLLAIHELRPGRVVHVIEVRELPAAR